MELKESALEDILNLGVWRLRDAAWIFSGYSPFRLNRNGHLRRLAGDEAIAIGSLEYRAAEEDMKAMEQLLMKQVGDSIGTELVFEKVTNEDGEQFVDVYEKPDDHFDRNWLIDQVVNFMHIDVWWIDEAIAKHWIPSYIRPNSLPSILVQTANLNSFHYPKDPKKIVNAFVPYEQPSKENNEKPKLLEVPDAYLEEKLLSKDRYADDAEIEYPSADKFVGLFDRQSVQPKTRFYRFLIDFVVENFMLKGLEQPTALQLYEALEVWQEKHDVDPVIGKPEIDWLISREITKEKFITWKELNPPEGKKAEKGKMTLGTLATRLDSWFTNRRCTLP